MILMKLILCFIGGISIGLIIALVNDAITPHTLDGKVNNYPMDKVSIAKMTTDKHLNNLSNKQVKRNIINGKYNK